MARGVKNTWVSILRRRILDPETGCRNWVGQVDEGGYGYVGWHGEKVNVHRLIYFFHFPNADRTLKVCHTCDNGLCSEITHLFLGTQADNIADKVSKNRQLCGEQIHQSKLTRRLVNRIRLLYNTRLFYQRELAAIFNVSDSQIQRIVNGHNW